MSRIELTTAVRKGAEECQEFLTRPESYAQFLPTDGFEGVQSVSPSALSFQWRILGRWWPTQLHFQPVQGAGPIVMKSQGAPFPFTWTWTLKPMKTDRRGARTEVHLAVDYDPPGGALGRLAAGVLLERGLIRLYDPALRNLPEVLGVKLRSGLREGADA